MKKNLWFMPLFLLALLSCKNDKAQNVEEPILSDKAIADFASEINFFDGLKTDTIVLFDKNINDDSNQKEQVLTQFHHEINSLVDSYTVDKSDDDLPINLITYKLNYADSKLFCTDLVYWHKETKTPIKVIEYTVEPKFTIDCSEKKSVGLANNEKQLIKQLQDLLQKEPDCLQINLINNLEHTKWCFQTCQNLD